MRQKGRAKRAQFFRRSRRDELQRAVSLSTRSASRAHALRVSLIGNARPSRTYAQVNDISSLPLTDSPAVACRRNREDEAQRMGLFLSRLSLPFSRRLGLSRSGSPRFFSRARSLAGTKYNARLSARFHHRPCIPGSSGKSGNFHR